METEDISRWPMWSILGYGTLGSKTPAGRRYHYRSAITLAAYAMVWPISVYFQMTDHRVGWKILSAIAPGLAFSYIAWEARRYWLALDELARRLMLESAAWTYLIGMAAGTLLGGISFLFFDHPWIWFWCNPLWVVLLEPVRGTILYFLTRRY